jgi:hypothetical protein
VSHHFDTPTAREDPRLNLCDLYLFRGGSAPTVMAMTANPAATADTVAPFRDEAIYAFRFDTDGDGREDVSFKMRFGEAIHVDGHEDPLHAQEFEIRRAEDGPTGLDGELLASGCTDSAVAGAQNVRAFAGVVHDPFAGDAAALNAFKDACAHGIYQLQAFDNRVNYFHQCRVAVAVLEVPNHLVSTSPSVKPGPRCRCTATRPSSKWPAGVCRCSLMSFSAMTTFANASTDVVRRTTTTLRTCPASSTR